MSNVNLAHMQQSLNAVEAKDYMPGLVSWADGDRGVLPNGQLSVFGSNNTDAKLKGKSGQVFPYLRTKNYDEKLGVTFADRIVMGVEDGKEVTAQQVLETVQERAKKQGFTNVNIAVKPKQPVVVRFMNAFVPLQADQKTECVVPTHYSFQTRSKGEPRNFMFCGHKGGIDVQCDGLGENPLYALKTEADGTISTHYYTVEESKHAVGVAQTTSNGQDQPPEIGIKGMGPRGNAFVIMSIPNKMKPIPRSTGLSGLGGFSYAAAEGDDDGAPVYRSLGAAPPNLGCARAAILDVDQEACGEFENVDPPIEWDGNESIVITVLYYNTLRNTSGKNEPIAVPSLDVATAVSDMERAYQLCEGSGYLSELPTMLIKMTPAHYAVIQDKMDVDPPEGMNKFAFKKGAAAEVLLGKA